jgi:hypothetical protein
MSVSAVASNPNVSGTDKISWPVTATHVNDREDAANIFRLLSDPGKEITKVLYLDRDGKIVGRRVVAVGLVGTTPANSFSKRALSTPIHIIVCTFFFAKSKSGA